MQYTDVNRGIIQHRDRARQIIDFSSLRFRKITPTDMDGLIEYRNKGFIFFEYKYQNAKMPDGQKLALERMVDAIQEGGKEAVLFLCSHNVEDTRQDVDAASALVVATYYRGKWTKCNGTKTALDRAISFVKWIEDKAV